MGRGHRQLSENIHWAFRRDLGSDCLARKARERVLGQDSKSVGRYGYLCDDVAGAQVQCGGTYSVGRAVGQRLWGQECKAVECERGVRANVGRSHWLRAMFGSARRKTDEWRGQAGEGVGIHMKVSMFTGAVGYI